MKELRFVGIILVLCLCLVRPLRADTDITPSEVYMKAEEIAREAELLKRHFGINETVAFEPFQVDLQPRHVWQKLYFIHTKINVLRTKNKFPGITANSMEPVLQLEPYLNYEQAQRILLELHILKDRLGIKEEITPVETIEGKQSVDVFNKLHEVSLQLEALNREPVTAEYVFAEAMRVFDDVVTILQWFDIDDKTFPPAKVGNVTLSQTLDETFAMMKEIQRLQRHAGLQITDFSPFHKKEDVRMSDIFNMTGMCLAELMPLKAYTGIKELTPAAQYHEAKTIVEVHQLLSWITRKLKLVREVR
ncbi:MAG TPA: hypothetical protein VJL89_10420 [Thermodesulfovibrionia bacterium]|nr:hypothetical protein [Thermodesulfovibrionia bacterium]